MRILSTSITHSIKTAEQGKILQWGYTCNDDDHNDDGDDNPLDLYIIGAVCGSRKMITSSWESPVTT